MKIFTFLIQLIIFSKIFTVESKSKKKKGKRMLENYFKNIIRNKNLERKRINKFIKGNSDELSYDFNYWERKQYNNLKSNRNKKNKIYNNNNEYIDYITKEVNVVKENYKTNDLLNKINNRKFKEYEESIEHIKLYDLNKDNSHNNNHKKHDINFDKRNPYQNPEFEYEYQYQNHFPDQNMINEINNINNINYMNQMNNHHRNPRGFSQNFKPHQMGGQSSYYNSHNYQQSNHQNNNNNYQTYSTNSRKSKFGGYFSSVYQILMALGFVGLIYRLFFGNRQNDKYAMVWYEANIDYFKERYESVGLIEDEITGTYRKPDDDIVTKSSMIKEDMNNYRFICGNYRYIKYIVINLFFQKKYDVSFFLTSFFMSTSDKITYQVNFNSVDPCGWVFCIARNRKGTGIKKGYEDLNCFCEIYHPKFMSDYMCLISEDLNIFDEMFENRKLLEYYRRIEYFIDHIYYSDTINSYIEENNIYFTFDIDLNMSYPDRIFLEITHFVNLFVDSLAQIRFSDETKQKIKNKRESYRENKIREDMKEEIEEREKKEFIEQFKIKNQMKGKTGFERKKLEKKLKKRNHK